MKGAITEPLAKISNAPRMTMMAIIGASHSFLRDRKKAHISLINAPMIDSKLIFKRFGLWARWGTIDPIRLFCRTL